jgi:hypothetical protein
LIEYISACHVCELAESSKGKLHPAIHAEHILAHLQGWPPYRSNCRCRQRWLQTVSSLYDSCRISVLGLARLLASRSCLPLRNIRFKPKGDAPWLSAPRPFVSVQSLVLVTF